MSFIYANVNGSEAIVGVGVACEERATYDGIVDYWVSDETELETLERGEVC